MEIYKINHIFESKNSTLPYNVKLLSIDPNSTLIILYEQDKVYYESLSLRSCKYIHAFFEIINNSLLWTLQYEVKSEVSYSQEYPYRYSILFKILINTELITSYLDTSMALNSVYYEIFIQLSNFLGNDFLNKSIIPYGTSKEPHSDFKITLYDYQKKSLNRMMQIENGAFNAFFEYTYPLEFESTEILYDPILYKKVNNSKNLMIKTNGGILADEMGLGKTITTIALISTNPAPINHNMLKQSRFYDIKKIASKATVIVCPSHLTKQWANEIKKCNPKLSILMILSKNDYKNIKFKDFMDSDIIITSHQFIMNFKFYPTLYYKQCTPTNINLPYRMEKLGEELTIKLLPNNINNIREEINPLFEFFYFHRLILDEGHEIFGGNMGNYSQSKYMSEWLSDIDSSYYWYVSGTPFVNYTGMENCAKFINMKIMDIENKFEIDLSTRNSKIYNTQKKMTAFFVDKEYFWNRLLNRICIRHRKDDVKDQINIPGYKETIEWLDFTGIERDLYNAKKNNVPSRYLQQLCCHPLIIESTKQLFGNSEVDLETMQDKLIEHHKNNYEYYSKRLEKLDTTNQAYHMLKKKFTDMMNESKYIYNILDRMKTMEIDEECSICMEQFNNPVLTVCGHLFCCECLKASLNIKKTCPTCRKDLTDMELILVKKQNKPIEDNPLIQKYGSKLGFLITKIKSIIMNEKSRIIVFSQWDDMLNLVGKTLGFNGICNSFVKGNVYMRNNAINKFKNGKTIKGDDNKVIMLSLKNSASGTNLTEASHIFFVEPINAPYEECKAIEDQAIARSCRIGQTEEVQIIRILIKDTIEETIYNTSYKNNTIII
jgi:SNF2 family DNA or RNA helicase